MMSRTITRVAVVFLPLLAVPAFSRITAAQEKSPSPPDPFQLALILKAGREYSQRLEKAALDFVCQEEVTDKIDLSKDSRRELTKEVLDSTAVSNAWYSSHHGDLRFDRTLRGGMGTSVYLFDYQFIRRAGQITENRTLLKKNGKKAGANEPIPKTAVFQYSDILIVPVQILDERFREFYRYRLLREDAHDGVKCWVVEVSPSLSVVEKYLGGRIWLKQDDYSILKIEWDPATYSGYEKILLRAKASEAEARVTSLTEFGFEKNGIRFPSRDFTEEAYLGKDGKLFVRSQTQVVYKNYKFFTVETATEFKK